jgi:catechol 2,3-dioxygenase-like lactoylglutathione lyase family enzyme
MIRRVDFHGPNLPEDGFDRFISEIARSRSDPRIGALRNSTGCLCWKRDKGNGFVMPSEGSTAVPFQPSFHHVGVQTSDLANSAAWYRAFFCARQSWSLTTFSDLTLSRLPGIRQLVELVAGNVRVHLFERDGLATVPGESVSQLQHVCLAVSRAEDLDTLRARWIELYHSGQFRFAISEQPTPVVVDDDGVCSFYAYDVNGLEFEFTYVPRTAPR